MKTLEKYCDEVTFCMTNFSLYKLTGKVWHSPTFYYKDGYNYVLQYMLIRRKGAGAGTHVSVELLQIRGEHDDKLKWREEAVHEPHVFQTISLIAQHSKAQLPEKISREFFWQCDWALLVLIVMITGTFLYKKKRYVHSSANHIIIRVNCFCNEFMDFVFKLDLT